MNCELVGEAGVSAFMRSVRGNLGGHISRMKLNYTPFLYYNPTQDLEKLEENLTSFQDLLQDGEARRLREESVDQWMDDIKHLLYDVEDFLDDMKGLSNDQVRVHQLYVTSNEKEKKLKFFLARTESLMDRAKDLQLKRGVVYALWGEEKVTTGDKSEIIHERELDRTFIMKKLLEVNGREKDKDVIVKRLLEADIGKGKKKYDVVGIWGMGGLGKTTLAQLVFNDPEVERLFELRRWVCISDVFDVRQAIKGLIGDDSAAGDAESLPNLLQRLQKIIQNRRFLFVLDDVWPSTGWNEKWNMIKAPFNSCQTGSKIVVTTRDFNIARALGDEKPYQLKGLPHEQCISLFKDKSFGNGDVDEAEKEKLMKWGETIVRACKGHPLSVKVIGSMLQTTEEEKWQAVSKNSDLWDTSNIKDGIHPAIRLGYHYLPASLKRCFEYLAVFPPDYEFQQDDVVRLWIADGLVQEVDGRMPEDIGNEYYSELKARSLIQENDMMHDIVRHLATVVSRKFCYEENSKEPHAILRHAFLVNGNSMHYEFLAQAPRLRTFIVERSKDENCLRNTIRSCKMLRTLKIISHHNYSLGGSSIGQLTHLRYLMMFGLDSGHLLDSLCMLDNLKFLDLNEMHLENLPDRMNHLSNLRSLTLRCSPISSLPESICDLSQLQVLSLRECVSFKHLPNDVGNLKSLLKLDLEGTSISRLPESICSLSELQFLKLSSCKSLAEIPKDIGNLWSLRTLDLRGSPISSLPESICALGQLQVLSLRECGSFKHLPYDVGNLRSLLKLDLEGTSISRLPESICYLSQLQFLNLSSCKSLAEIPKDIGNLRNLRTLDLRGSPISRLPESICALGQLHVLGPRECREPKELFEA